MAQASVLMVDDDPNGDHACEYWEETIEPDQIPEIGLGKPLSQALDGFLSEVETQKSVARVLSTTNGIL